ncbi:MAG TPA: DUF4197 domain-containing protein, partial [Terriglobia bacterium]|nr:DUF4197 domain-containing protein [Terriglobia bacterium]
MNTAWTLSLLSLVLVSGGASSQFSLSKVLNKISPAVVTEAEAGQGIKEALTQGVTTAVLNLNKKDGFFGSEVYKVLLPPDAKKVESTLRKIGLGSQVDKAVLAINRGAEDAVGSAKPIFVDAIKEMTVTDALGIVRGNKYAATQYFKQKTSEK